MDTTLQEVAGTLAEPAPLVGDELLAELRQPSVSLPLEGTFAWILALPQGDFSSQNGFRALSHTTYTLTLFCGAATRSAN